MIKKEELKYISKPVTVNRDLRVTCNTTFTDHLRSTALLPGRVTSAFVHKS